MTYATLLEQEGIAAQFLAVLKPRRKLGTFTLYSGSVYSISFDYGQVVTLAIDGVELTEAFTTTLSASEFYYDNDTSTLYVRNAGSTDPTTDFCVATYEIYVGTFDAHFNRIPTDDTSRTVYFEPLITKSPVLNTSASDYLFGFIPVSSTSITLSNATQIFERHIYDSSFHDSEIDLYHWLDDLITTNVKKVFTGLMSDVSYDTDKLNIKVSSKIELLSTEFRNYAASISFYAESDFPGYTFGPNLSAKPIRHIYGKVDGVPALNVNYSQTLSASTNEAFTVMSETTNVGDINVTVAASPSSTTTRTYLVTAQGLNVDDSVWLDRVSGIDEYVILTDVNYVSNYIEHEAIASPMAGGDSVKRSAIGSVTIIQNNVKYNLKYGVHYNPLVYVGGNVLGFSLLAGYEIDLGMTTYFGPNDRIYCRAYGQKNTVTLNGSPFGTNDAYTGNLTNPIAILVELMKSGLGISEDDMNLASFTTVEAARTDALGFSVPQTIGNQFPTYKSIISDILETTLTRLYLDENNQWTIVEVGPLGTTTLTAENDEILRDSLSYDFDYSDVISDAIVEYNFREIANDVSVLGNTVQQVSATSETAKYLHKINKQHTIQSLYFREDDAAILAQRISYALGDRSGKASISVKNRFFESVVSDVIAISRTRLPGYEFDATIDRTRKFSALEINKSLNEVTITLDDQKGIEDNSGSW
jgi:hypothetical protein